MPVSSKQILAGLRREGFTESQGTGGKGSHRTWYRKRQRGLSQTVTVVLGQREIPKGTLRSYARQLGMSLDEFMAMIR